MPAISRGAGPNTPATPKPGSPGYLKWYWIYGKGRRKWDTWTELYHHLLKHMTPGMAKRTAATWFHIRYGFWPGADLNRVRKGKPPRGQVVGPG